MSGDSVTVWEWTRAVRRSGLDRTTKAIAQVLATYADADGTRVFPGVARLAVDSTYSPATVKRSLATLRRVELIQQTRRGGAGRASEYRLILGPNVAELAEVVSPAAHEAEVEKLADANRERWRRSKQRQRDNAHPDEPSSPVDNSGDNAHPDEPSSNGNSDQLGSWGEWTSGQLGSREEWNWAHPDEPPPTSTGVTTTTNHAVDPSSRNAPVVSDDRRDDDDDETSGNDDHNEDDERLRRRRHADAAERLGDLDPTHAADLTAKAWAELGNDASPTDVVIRAAELLATEEATT